MSLRLPRIYAITDRSASGGAEPVAIAQRLLAVGVRCLQVREKAMADRDLLPAVESIASLGRAAGARVLVDDRVDVARIACVGVHLGEQDLPASAARAILGPDAAIGISTHDLAAARREFAGADSDYLAFGPVFDSRTKTGREPRGLDALAQVAAERTKPLVAIGGITLDRLDAVWDAGADSAAMISGLLAGGRIEDNARRALDAGRRRGSVGRIFLVGFMGCGKTAIGLRVAERLALPFVDLDREIERSSGKTVRVLFEESGEAAFRSRESAYLQGTASLPAAVVATGGGCFAQDVNRRAIQGLGISVFLDVPLTTVHTRLAGKTDRPLFRSPEQLEQLFLERAPFYRMASVHVGLSGAETIEEASDRVLVALEGLGTLPV
ncbi:MAG: thiamine phosphate synthase [Acidobacteriota bacterium]